jgi:2-polyprenyl-6-hydroxyphenyl methylase/3-demethylubiquinone-9 3-methyltransferase
MSNLKWKIAQWFELRWWKAYLRDKNKEQYLSWKKNYWNNLLQQIKDAVNLQNDLTIADLGCGPAGVFIALPGNHVTAVDPLLDKYERETPFFKKNDYPNVEFVTSTVEGFIPHKKFDVVFCLNAINHVSDIARAYDVLTACTSPSGKMVVSVDAHNHTFFKHLFRLIPGDVLHPHQYNLREYELFLEKRGRKILKTVLLKREFFFSHYVLVAG